MNYRIEYGYDRHVRCWCIIVFDENGYEVESDYSGNLHDCEYMINEFKVKYNTTGVKKIKAY